MANHNESSHTLVVIDMQPFFKPSHDIVPNVLNLINQAKTHYYHIIIVEYVHYHSYCFCCDESWETHKVITNTVKDYEKHHIIKKKKNDGSKEILEHILKHSLPKELLVCGVNTDVCVYDTVKGISKHYAESVKTAEHKINVILDSCNTEYLEDMHKTILVYKKLNNVHLTEDFKSFVKQKMPIATL